MFKKFMIMKLFLLIYSPGIHRTQYTYSIHTLLTHAIDMLGNVCSLAHSQAYLLPTSTACGAGNIIFKANGKEKECVCRGTD